MEKEVTSVTSLLSSLVYITSVIVQLSLYSTVNVYTKYGAHAVSDYDFAATFFDSSFIVWTFSDRT